MNQMHLNWLRISTNLQNGQSVKHASANARLAACEVIRTPCYFFQSANGESLVSINIVRHIQQLEKADLFPIGDSVIRLASNVLRKPGRTV